MECNLVCMRCFSRALSDGHAASIFVASKDIINKSIG